MKKYSVFVLLISLLVAPIPIRCQERFPESSVLRQKTFSNNEKKQRAQLAKDETLEAYARMRAERDSKDKYGHSSMTPMVFAIGTIITIFSIRRIRSKILVSTGGMPTAKI